MTGEAHHRINWATATVTIASVLMDGPDLSFVGKPIRLVIGPIGGEWRARVFDADGALLFNEVALSTTKDRANAWVTFPNGTAWQVVRDGDCGCGN